MDCLSRHFHGFVQSRSGRPSTHVSARSGPNGQPQSAHPLVLLLLFVAAAVVSGTLWSLGASVIVWLLVDQAAA